MSLMTSGRASHNLHDVVFINFVGLTAGRLAGLLLAVHDLVTDWRVT